MNTFDIRKVAPENQRNDVTFYELIVNFKVKVLGAVQMKQVAVYSRLSEEEAKELISLNVDTKKSSNTFKASDPWYHTKKRTQTLDEYAGSTIYKFMKTNHITFSGMSEDIDVPYEQLEEMFWGLCSWDLNILCKIEAYYGLDIIKVKKS